LWHSHPRPVGWVDYVLLETAFRSREARSCYSEEVFPRTKSNKRTQSPNFKNWPVTAITRFGAEMPGERA